MIHGESGEFGSWPANARPLGTDGGAGGGVSSEVVTVSVVHVSLPRHHCNITVTKHATQDRAQAARKTGCIVDALQTLSLDKLL